MSKTSTLLEEESIIRQYRHDMKNHLLCISVLLRNERIQEAIEYIEGLQNGIKIVEGKGQKNLILHKLIEEKIRIAEEMDVVVDCRIDIDRELNVKNTDWSILLGNALDNALEALEKVPKKKRQLWIKIIDYEGMLAGKIKNTIATEVKEGYATTKEDKALHGIGIPQMRRIVSGYNGSLKIKEDGEAFEIVFFLQGV